MATLYGFNLTSIDNTLSSTGFDEINKRYAVAGIGFIVIHLGFAATPTDWHESMEGYRNLLHGYRHWC
jgi:hypothetical protein